MNKSPQTVRLWPWRPGPREDRLDTGRVAPAEDVRVDDADVALARFNLIGIADLHGLWRAMRHSSPALRLYQPNAATARGAGLRARTVGLALRWRVNGNWHALPCPRSGTPGPAIPTRPPGRDPQASQSGSSTA